jgi:hypothetical protein
MIGMRCLHAHRPVCDPLQCCKIVDENSPGITTRRSLGDDKFDSIDDFGKNEFLTMIVKIYILYDVY